jgi:GT2 family glycosyltransferase
VIDLSIVVVTWNTRALVLECLGSIERASQPIEGRKPLDVELLVVDNGSTDGTAEAIRESFPRARVIRLPRNLGFAAGGNAGFREVAGRHVLLLNSDTRVVPGTLERCVRFLDENPEVGIIGPQLLNTDGSKQNSIHNYPIIATELVPKGVFQFLFRRRFPSRRWSGGEPIDVEAVTGAALFTRAELIRSVGLLPEEYFFFLEETDWCWRAREAGWRVVHLPTAQVVHLSGGSSKRKNPGLTRIEYHRSLYRFYRKHRGMQWMALALSLRLVKALFYVVSQAPLALFGGRLRSRWKMHWDVLAWHLRGCPATVGLERLSDGAVEGQPLDAGRPKLVG